MEDGVLMRQSVSVWFCFRIDFSQINAESWLPFLDDNYDRGSDFRGGGLNNVEVFERIDRFLDQTTLPRRGSRRLLRFDLSWIRIDI